MRPNVVKAASARLAASLLMLAAAPAFAGDAAVFDPIGFSEDGRYFAYEEFGIQDGSGFPYASVFLIDLKEDKWVGTPARVRVDDESAGLQEARGKAMGEAQKALDGAGIVMPAKALAINADGEVRINGYDLAFGKHGNGLDEPQDPVNLNVGIFDSTTTEPCASYGMEQPVQGFALTLIAADGTATELHKDASVPASRGCVSDYRLYGVFAPFYQGIEDQPMVAVVSVYSLGFEGPDRRFVAVPIQP